MGVSRHTLRLAWGLVIAALVVIAHDGYGLWQAHGFNTALRQRSAFAGTQPDTPRKRFAEAYRLHEQGEYREALLAYGSVASDRPRLAAAVKFNIANLYIEYARQLETRDGRDLSLPLYELAKESYRELLRANPAHWPAKYNLEVVLGLAPESGYEEAADEYMPEHSRRAAGTVESREELP